MTTSYKTYTEVRQTKH